MNRWPALFLPLVVIAPVGFGIAAPSPAPAGSKIRAFVDEHCTQCHEGDTAKGKLDLDRLNLALEDPKTFATWVKVYDRVAAGEMPPKERPDARETAGFLGALADPLIAADLAREAAEGRAVKRRLNRYEYESTLRDLFAAPWLQVKDMLPEDGEAFRFNKIGSALDVSHVQLAQYVAAADYAMREVLAAELEPPAYPPRATRYHARDMRSYRGLSFRGRQNSGSVRSTFPVLGSAAQPEILRNEAPYTVGDTDPAKRELEGVGIIHGTYEPVEPRFEKFHAPRAGRYRIKLAANTIWVGARDDERDWWWPDFSKVSAGRRSEPITVYAQRAPNFLRRLGTFDARPDLTVGEFDVYLLEGETIRADAARFFRSRPPRTDRKRPHGSEFHNPFATKEGQPGVSIRWMEAEGPLFDEWPPAGRSLLFGELPVRLAGKQVEVTTADPPGDARRLITAFLSRAYRQPARDEDVALFAGLAARAMASGASFGEAMMTAYAAVLCSPAFVYLQEDAGRLGDWALASRLSYFLWNGPPDEALRAAAARGDLSRGPGLRAQAERMLEDPRARRFVDAFLDYWLDLRRVGATSPDAVLYPDYNLDDHLFESAPLETQLFFAELLRKDLPARNVISSDFTFVNERLARHYGLQAPRGVTLGAELQKVPIPAGSPRGGLLTQASVLKVTANGTTTSPVLRGVWICERLLGITVPPPPPGTPAVEPDIRGAHTIREQLDKHRSNPTCASCHRKIDPPGFALEAFDVFGGLRAKYRAVGDPDPPAESWGKDGIRYEFHDALPVDASGALPDGRKFNDVVALKRLMLKDERAIARNLAKQLVTYATGAPVRFGDRPRLEALLDGTAGKRWGVRSLVLAIVDSELFRNK